MPVFFHIHLAEELEARFPGRCRGSDQSPEAN